jgi:hypothetical protein
MTMIVEQGWLVEELDSDDIARGECDPCIVDSNLFPSAAQALQYLRRAQAKGEPVRLGIMRDDMDQGRAWCYVDMGTMAITDPVFRDAYGVATANVPKKLLAEFSKALHG